MEDPHLQLDALPDNCVHRVLSLLPLDSLCACAAVSRHLRSLVDDSLLWQDVDITASRVQCAAPIGDATLRCIALKARGKMTRLAVSGCKRISPAGVVFAARLNPALVRAQSARSHPRWAAAPLPRARIGALIAARC